MAIFETLFAVSVLFWGVLLLYVFWVDRKLVVLRKKLQSLEEEHGR